MSLHRASSSVERLPPAQAVVSLGARAPTVNLVNRSEDNVVTAKVKRDSLESTRNFYGVNAGSSSRALGLSSTRVGSPPPRPPSRQSSIHSYIAPSPTALRNPAPLPAPSNPSSGFTSGVLPSRAFFAPQKPAGATVKRAPAVELEMSEASGGGRGWVGATSASSRQRETSEADSLALYGIDSGAVESQEGLVATAGAGTRARLGSMGPATQSREPLIPGSAGYAGVASNGYSAHNKRPSREEAAPPSAPFIVSNRGGPLHSYSPPKPSTSHAASSPPTPLTPTTPGPPPSSSGPKTRRYQVHQASNHFFLRGRIVTGGDNNPGAFVLALILMLGVGALWLGSTGVWMWRNGVGGNGGGTGIAVVIVFAWLWLVAVGAMIGTAMRDPGIIPRDLDLNPPLMSSMSTETLYPVPRELKVRAGKVVVKYCETCKIYRPPRSSHCRICGNCVDGIDHHCTYLHTCVGRRNYTSFISFLLSTTLSLHFVVIFSAIHLWRLTALPSSSSTSFGRVLARNAPSAVAFVLALLLAFPVGSLLVFHLRLMFRNSTTIEEIRRSAAVTLHPPPGRTSLPCLSFLFFWRHRRGLSPAPDKPANPFAFPSGRTNFARMLCRPPAPSWAGFRDVVAGGDERQERRQPRREHAPKA